MLAALVAAGTANAAVLPLNYRLEPVRRPLRIVPACEAADDEILVCARRLPSFRVSGAAAPAPVDGRRFGIDLGPGIRLGGGGPKGSVGLNLTIAF